MHFITCFPFFFLIALFAVACTQNSLDDFREEGEGVTRSLIQELQAIHNREQLVASTGRLQKLFDKLVNVIIAAESFRSTHPNVEKTDLTLHNHELSDRLRTELNRLYRLEGGRQLIEKSQEAALNRLDAFEKQLSKQNEKRRLQVDFKN